MPASASDLELVVATISRDEPSSLRQYLDAGGDPNATYRGRCLLHWCAQESSSKCASILLDHGAKSCLSDQHGHFPLYQAAAEGSLDFVRLLVSRGAPVNQRTEAGTALGVACAYEHIPVVRFLVQQGGDHSLADKDGTTATSIAQSYKSAALIEALKGEPGTGGNR